jgi:hypothetical protein
MKSKGSNYRPWSAKELEALERGAQSMMTAVQMAQMYFPYRSPSSIRQKLDAMGWGMQTRVSADAIPLVRPVAEYTAPEGPTLAHVYAPQDSAEEDEATFIARMLGTATASITKAASQRHAKIRIASKAPVAISLLSDAHVSATGTDLVALLEYAQFVADTPGVYALGMGDLLDNPIKHKGGNVGQIADDLRFLDLLVARFRGKLLGTTSGNHDDWSKVLAGTDHLAALAKRHKIHYAPDELLWVVEIVNPDDADDVTARYRIHTRHQWRRGSALNPCHACWTWWQEEGMNWDGFPDVLAIGHNHVSAVESRQFETRDMWAIRPGTFQKDSSFARAKGYGRYRATTPTIVLPPTRADRVMCFADPVDAVQFMNGDRGDAA